MGNELETKGITKEQARRELALCLLRYMVIIISITLVGIFTLIYTSRLEPKEAVTLILAITSVFSGLLGSAITYYFSSK